MTTTELIELLKANECGGATHRPRTVNFYINGRNFIPEPIITVCGTGDGMFSDIYLDLKTDQNIKVEDIAEWVLDEYPLTMYHCSKCSHTVNRRTNYCSDCGAEMSNPEE